MSCLNVSRPTEPSPLGERHTAMSMTNSQPTKTVVISRVSVLLQEAKCTKDVLVAHSLNTLSTTTTTESSTTPITGSLLHLLEDLLRLTTTQLISPNTDLLDVEVRNILPFN